MTEVEILSQILHELKEINNTIQDLYSGSEAQHELMMSRLTVLESLVDKSNKTLTAIEENTNALNI